MCSCPGTAGVAADTIESANSVGYNKTSTIKLVVAVTAFQPASASASLPTVPCTTWIVHLMPTLAALCWACPIMLCICLVAFSAEEP